MECEPSLSCAKGIKLNNFVVISQSGADYCYIGLHVRVELKLQVETNPNRLQKPKNCINRNSKSLMRYLQVDREHSSIVAWSLTGMLKILPNCLFGLNN